MQDLVRFGSALLLAVSLGGCSGRSEHGPGAPTRVLPALASARSVGPGSRFRPAPAGAPAERAEPVAGMRCLPPRPLTAAAHLELFAEGHVVQIPAGIGIAPPRRGHGAYVAGGRCVYSLSTTEPTGVILMSGIRRATLGRLFELWGQPLTRTRLAGFSAARGLQVSVFLDGVRWTHGPRSAPLVPGAQVAVEVGAHVAPHSGYVFPALGSLAAGRRR